MNSGIYLITNTETGKQYVGQSSGIKKRFNRHIRASRIQHPRESFYLHKSMAKHGVDKFKFEVLIYAKDSEYLNLMEQKCIESYNTLSPNGYNLDTGGGVDRKAAENSKSKKLGKPAWNKGIPQSEEAKRKQSLAMMGKPSPQKGKPQSAEAKAKQSAAMKGRPAWNKGIKMSEDQKEKMRLVDKSYTKTLEYRLKMSASVKKAKAKQKGN